MPENLAPISVAADVPTKKYVDDAIAASAGITQAAADTRYVNVSGDTMTGTLSAPTVIGTSRVQVGTGMFPAYFDAVGGEMSVRDPGAGDVLAQMNVANPLNSSSAATKSYVDTGLAGKASTAYVDAKITPASSIAIAEPAAGANFVAGVNTFVVAANTGNSFVPPPGLATGDTCILVTSSDSAGAWTTTATGFSSVAGFASGTMYTNIMVNPSWDMRSSLDVTYSFSITRTTGVFWLRGATLGTVGTAGIRSGTLFTSTAPSLTSTGPGLRLCFFGQRNIAANATENDLSITTTYGTVAYVAPGNQTISSTSGISRIWLVTAAMTGAGTTGDNTATMMDSSGNGWGIQFPYYSGTSQTTGQVTVPSLEMLDSKLQVHRGPTQPTNPNVLLWIDTTGAV